MPRTLKAIPGATLLLAVVALAGCGASGSGTGSASSASAFGNIQLASSAISGPATGAPIPAKYTCDGKDIAPPLEWGTVPAGTKELAIVLISIGGGSAGAGFNPVWAMAGVNPELHKLAAGEVPPGAFLGRNEKGQTRYSLCPAKGASATYQFGVYSLRPSVTPSHGFEDNALIKEIASGPSATSATAGGGFRVTYTRK
jgi:phosphatidylethanolamine-binding protein (PEBP) family uncharacterized protein